MADIRNITYGEFKDEYAERLRKNPIFQGAEVRNYEKGYCNESDQDLILNTNEMYFRQRCTYLLKDFMIIKVAVKTGDKMLRINAEEAYKAYKEQGWNYLLEEDAKSFTDTFMIDNVENLVNGNWQIERMIIRPINYNDNKHLLKEAVYWKIGDVALVLYFIANEKDHTLSTVKVQRMWMENEGREEDATLIEALLNTNLLYPPRIYGIKNYSPSFDEGQFMNFSYTEKLKPFYVYRLTTAAGLNGAVALFYPGVQEKLAELIGGDYFVGFISLNEAVIQSTKIFTARNVREAVKDVNSHFSKEDFLTNKVFRYDAEKGELEVI